MKFSYVFPIYNQEATIRQTIEGYYNAISALKFPFEFILVVNGSRDNSMVLAEETARALPHVKAYELKKGGWGRAVKYGIQQATGDIICYTNTARTEPKSLQLMTIYSNVNPDTVIKAERKIRESPIRRVGSLIYNIQLRLMFELAHWDVNGTPKFFNRKFSKLLNLVSEDDMIDAEFVINCRREDYPILIVPINESPRFEGKSTTNYSSAFRMYSGAFRLQSHFRNSEKSGTP